MSELRFDAVGHGELTNLTASFGAGCHVVLGHEGDGTATLILLAEGSVRPRAGRVSLDAQAPGSTPVTRRSIASLTRAETLLPCRFVVQALELALRARGDAGSGSSVLDAAGLSHLGRRRVTEVSARDARAIALALALSHPAPRLLALHEPLGLLRDDFVLQTLTARAEGGAIVLSTTNRLEDAAQLGGTLRHLARGVWLDPRVPPARTVGVTLRIRTEEPRRLVTRLAEAPDITGVEWPGGQELLVRGNDLTALAQSVVKNARAEAIRVTALKQELPTRETLTAARLGLAPGADERALDVPAARQP